MRRQLVGRGSALLLAIALAIGLVPGASAGSSDGTIGALIGVATAAPAQHVHFVGRVTPLPHALEAEMRGTTWRPGCPVSPDDLRLLAISYWGFDDRPHLGPLVVSASVAGDVVLVFRQLFDARFPIKTLQLAKRFRPQREEHDTRRDPTAGFNCREVVTPFGPSTSWSQHAYGLAIDINPLENPYVVDGYVRNRFARPYRDRSRALPGMIHDGDVVVRSFAAIGWSWGGDWSSGQDYMHFSLTGR